MIIGQPQLLHLLWLVPALAGLGLLGSWLRGRRLQRWASRELWVRIAPERSRLRRAARYGLALVALAFAVMAAARPQVGAKLVQVDRQGIEVVVALDVSLSMVATDVVPNRLERSKQEIRELLEGLPGDRVGVLLFSGTSFLLCPLTLDVAAANLFLDAVTVDVLPDPGTNVDAALAGARRALEKDETGGARVVILFTDGEAHEGSAVETARGLGEAGIPVLTVGVGTPNGEPIPVFDAGGRRTGYKKDRSGNVVLSRLDEGLLKQVADVSHGRYYPATLQGHEIGEILDTLHKMERGELGGGMRRRVEERYQIPAGIAALFLFLSLLLPEGKREEADAAPSGGTAGS